MLFGDKINRNNVSVLHTMRIAAFFLQKLYGTGKRALRAVARKKAKRKNTCGANELSPVIILRARDPFADCRSQKYFLGTFAGHLLLGCFVCEKIQSGAVLKYPVVYVLLRPKSNFIGQEQFKAV